LDSALRVSNVEGISRADAVRHTVLIFTDLIGYKRMNGQIFRTEASICRGGNQDQLARDQLLFRNLPERKNSINVASGALILNNCGTEFAI